MGYKSTKIYLLGHVKKYIMDKKDLFDYFSNTDNISKLKKVKNENGIAKRISKSDKKPSHEITMDLFLKGTPIDDIVKERNLKMGSIIAHLIKFMPNSNITWDKFMSKDEYDEVHSCFDTMGLDTSFNLIKRNVNRKISYDKIRLVRSFLNVEIKK